MDAIAGNEVFEHYLQLPENARTEVIAQMEPDDRVRFTRCSKLCSKEAQAAKKYVHSLKVFCRKKNMMTIIVVTREDENGFDLTIARRNDRIFKTYHSLVNVKLWEDELDSSTDLVQYAIEELKYRMKIYQGSIKLLKIHDDVSMLANVDLEIESLNNLETLEMGSTVDVSQIFSKLQKPLKELCIYGTNNTSSLSNYEQICQVQSKIYWPNANFDLEQLQRLAAKNVETNIGQLTEKDIFKFIRSWQDGTIGREIEEFEWYLAKTKFDMNKLLRLLRVQDRKERKIEIKHYYEAGKRAILRVNRFYLNIRTIFSDFDSSDSDSSDSDSDF